MKVFTENVKVGKYLYYYVGKYGLTKITSIRCKNPFKLCEGKLDVKKYWMPLFFSQIKLFILFSSLTRY